MTKRKSRLAMAFVFAALLLVAHAAQAGETGLEKKNPASEIQVLALIVGSATLCFSGWIQRGWRKLHRFQNGRKHRAWLLTKKTLCCCGPVRPGQKKIMGGGEALSFTR